MSNKDKGLSTSAIVGIIIASIIILYAICANAAKNTMISNCSEQGKNYDSTTGTCKEKSAAEKFVEKCDTNKTYTYGSNSYTCSEIKKAGLENAFNNNNIVSHGSSIYEGGTKVEVNAGKEAGDYCLSATESWSHIGETRCVVFSYTQLSCSNGYCFLNEKKDYKNGFVAFFGKYGMYSWDNFYDTYYNQGPILVCGTIQKYEGHPEIKITNVSKQTKLNPTSSKSGTYTVYKYACN